MFKIILYVITSIIVVLIILWGILEFIIFDNNYPSYLSNAQWGAFISTYLAGTLGGVIALLGIGYQLKHDKDKTKYRIKNYIKYFIKKNIGNQHFEYMLILSEMQLSYERSLLGEEIEDDTKFLLEFDNNYIRDNTDEILKLGDIGESILDLNSEIIKFNKVYSKMLNNLNNKKDFLDKLEADPSDNQPLQILIFFLRKYSIILNSVISQEAFLSVAISEMFQSGERTFNLTTLSNYNEFKSTLTSNFLNFETFNFEKKLEKITDSNQKFIEFNFKLLGNIIFNPNQEELKMELYKYNNLNARLTGCALEIYNLLKKLQNEL